MMASPNKFRQMLDFSYRFVYTMFAVLCGELAVPCNSQSATARQNAYRGFINGRLTLASDVDVGVSCNSSL